MTVEQKKEALRNALTEGLCSTYKLIEWEVSKDDPDLFILDRKAGVNQERALYLAGCHDSWGGTISFTYKPVDDIVCLYVKDRPVHPKFKDDILNLFEKYSPFGMKLSFDENLTPVLSREERVEPKDFPKFLEEFRKAYDEFYPLFYFISVSAIAWYDGFSIRGTYCSDGVYY